MRNNRKANVFSALIVIALVAIFAYGSVQMIAKRHTLGMQIGEKQFQVFDAYNKGESALLFVDLAAKESIKETSTQLAGLLKSSCGGYFGEADYDSKCGEKTRTCFPSETEVKNRFIDEFRKRLDTYVSLFNSENPATPLTPPSAIEVFTEGKTGVVGAANDAETVNVNLPGMAYSAKTSFRQETDVESVRESSALVRVMKKVFENKISDEQEIRKLMLAEGFEEAQIESVDVASTQDNKCVKSLDNNACSNGQSEKESTYYDKYAVSIKAKSREKMPAYSEAEGQELSSIEYPFSVSWVEEDRTETEC